MLCPKNTDFDHKSTALPNPGFLSEQKAESDINVPKDQCKLTLGRKKQYKYTKIIKCTEYAISNNQNDKCIPLNLFFLANNALALEYALIRSEITVFFKTKSYISTIFSILFYP